MGAPNGQHGSRLLADAVGNLFGALERQTGRLSHARQVEADVVWLRYPAGRTGDNGPLRDAFAANLPEAQLWLYQTQRKALSGVSPKRAELRKLMVRNIKTLSRVFGVTCALLTLSGQSTAGQPAVSLGEVSTVATLTAENLSDFRVLVRSTFDRLRLRNRPKDRTYILSTSLIEFTTVEKPHSHTITCVVAAVLRDEREGVLKAVLKGTAKLSESDRPTRAGRRLAMQAAVRRALSRVDEALK